MRTAALVEAVAAASAIGLATVIAIAVAGCSSDAGTSVSALERRGGGFTGSGAPSTPSSNDPSNGGDGNQTTPHGSTPSPVVPDAGSIAPVAATTTTTGTGTTTIDAGGSQTSVGGCADGCADGCITLAINFCKTASADYQDFCSQVPASCACNETGSAPAAPSLQQCITDIENGADNGGDDTGN